MRSDVKNEKARQIAMQSFKHSVPDSVNVVLPKPDTVQQTIYQKRKSRRYPKTTHSHLTTHILPVTQFLAGNFF